MVRKLISGLPLTGKTTRLIEEYHSLAQKNVKTDEILVLVQDSIQVGRWRSSINLPVSGRLNIFTYWGLIQAEISKYWNWIEYQVFDSTGSALPNYINAETAHYVLTRLVDDLRVHAMFDPMVATSSQIALQILRNINLTAVSGLTVEAGFARMINCYASDQERSVALNDALQVAQRYRTILKESRCIDYGLAIQIYNELLMNKPEYQFLLQNQYKAIIIDNLEESLPVQVDLISFLLDHTDYAFAAFDPSGGHTTYFGADPDYAWRQLHEKFMIINIEDGIKCSIDAIRLAEALQKNIIHGTILTRVKVDSPKIETITRDYRSETILALTERIEQLIREGCPPGEIIVIAPSIDPVLNLLLSTHFKNRGIPLESLNRQKYLADEELAQVMIALAALINVQDRIKVGHTELARALGLMLDIDPVRSSILAHFCLTSGLNPDPPAEIVGRIGFAVLYRYQEFVRWIHKQREQKQDDELFQNMFAEMLAPIIHDYNDIITLRLIIKSAINFKKAHAELTGLSDQPFLAAFIDMINQRTVAADVIRIKDIDPDAVILATPIAFFLSSRPFAHQFWLDAANDIWFVRDVKELSNSYLMSRNWDGTWNEEKDTFQRFKNAARTSVGLILRSRESITLMVSEYDSMGLEQEGLLPEMLTESVTVI